VTRPAAWHAGVTRWLGGHAGTLTLAGGGPPPGRGLGVAALIAWLLTASAGGFMLRTVIAGDGLRRQRARPGGLSPAVLIGHFSLALAGLAGWACYLVSGWTALAWVAVVVLMPAIGLGISTVTLWTPYPDPPPSPRGPTGHGGGRPATGMLASHAEDALARRVTDEVLASALADEALAGRLIEEVMAGVRADPVRTGRAGGHLAALVPFAHGVGALVTFLLAVTTAVSATWFT
jgi:hypothetical protein